MTPEQRLMDAIVHCRIYQTRHLLASGAPAEFVDEEGYSPLLRACAIHDEKHRTRTSLIKLLIEYGADVNTADPKGHHALAQACLSEKQDIIRQLLDTSMHNIDLNKTDIHGDTPLMHVVRNGNVEIVKLLVDSMNKFYINMHVRNHSDRTPYLEAVELGRKECAQILLEVGQASTTVQVNPFLNILASKEDKHEKGEITNGLQSTGGKRRDSDEVRLRKNKSAKMLPVPRGGITPFYDNRLSKKRSVPVKILKKKNKVKTENIHQVHEIQPVQSNDTSEGHLDPSWPKLDGFLATDMVNTSRGDTVKRTRPHTAIINHEFEGEKKAENYNCLTSRVFPRSEIPQTDGSFVERHQRRKTAHIIKRCSSLSSLATKSSSGDVSWHSHFTLHNSPSVNFLNKIMNLYGEQLSPGSSYRKGVKPRKTDDSNTPAIVEPVVEHDHADKRSDGRPSSSGSIRSISSANRNKFSALSRTVATCISSKKGFFGSKSKRET